MKLTSNQKLIINGEEIALECGSRIDQVAEFAGKIWGKLGGTTENVGKAVGALLIALRMESGMRAELPAGTIKNGRTTATGVLQWTTVYPIEMAEKYSTQLGSSARIVTFPRVVYDRVAQYRALGGWRGLSKFKQTFGDFPFPECDNPVFQIVVFMVHLWYTRDLHKLNPDLVYAQHFDPNGVFKSMKARRLSSIVDAKVQWPEYARSDKKSIIERFPDVKREFAGMLA